VRSEASLTPLSPVLFLSDAFTEYFHPAAGLAAVRALEAAGCQVQVLPVTGAGRTLISKGFLEPARRHATRLVEAIARLDPEGRIPVVGVEPSEIYTLRDEYLDLLAGDPSVPALAARAYLVDEFLIRPGPDGEPRIARIAARQAAQVRAGRPKVLLHGHCYQKAQPPAADGYLTGVPATVAMLKALGYPVNVIDSSCCGMAGAFGYEAAHYDLSMKVAEMSLLPAVRAAAPGEIVAAAGVSCQEQIRDGTGRAAVHPVELVSPTTDG
jgi:Fe-S oxidoreductase